MPDGCQSHGVSGALGGGQVAQVCTPVIPREDVEGAGQSLALPQDKETREPQ